jgi:rubrerythrin
MGRTRCSSKEKIFMKSLSLTAVDVDGAVQETAEAVRGDTRLDFLRKGALAGGGIIGGGAALAALVPGVASAAAGVGRPSASFGAGDVGILNYALTLEYLESTFYNEALHAGIAKTPQLKQIVQTVVTDETAHVRLLKAALGSKAVAKPKFDFHGVPQDLEKFLATAFILENTGVRAYHGQFTNFTDQAHLVTATELATVEARHAGAIALYVGKAIAPQGPLDKPLTAAAVLSAVKSIHFIPALG